MKILPTIIICVVILLVCVCIRIVSKKNAKRQCGCCNGNHQNNETSAANYPHKTLVYIDGMSCAHCSNRVEKAFSELGNCTATVHLEEKYAEVLSEKPLPQTDVEAMIQNLGFTPASFTVLK